MQTIRYYEQIGLMPEPGRTEGGQRRCGDARLARLEALRTELKRMVHACRGGQTANCRVLEVLRDHSECLTDHDEIGA